MWTMIFILVLLHPAIWHGGHHQHSRYFLTVFVEQSFIILIQIAMKFVPEGRIDPLHNSHNAQVAYPIMHNFVTKVSKCVLCIRHTWTLLLQLCDLWDGVSWSLRQMSDDVEFSHLWSGLTHTQLETHVCVLSAVATDDLAVNPLRLWQM